MKIYIDSSIVPKYNFNFEEQIKFLLKFVPKEHLSKLEYIRVLNRSLTASNGKVCRGLYYGGRAGFSILLSAETLFRGMPRLFFYIPFIPRFVLAKTLYHEIGHHYEECFCYGVKKGLKEKYAHEYAKGMQKKAFKNYLLLFKLLFGPILLLRLILQKISKKYCVK